MPALDGDGAKCGEVQQGGAAEGRVVTATVHWHGSCAHCTRGALRAVRAVRAVRAPRDVRCGRRSRLDWRAAAPLRALGTRTRAHLHTD